MAAEHDADDASPKDDLPPIFDRDGETLIPRETARGPWYPNTQHGSPMLALLARAIERHPSEKKTQVTRLTVDLSRAAPMGPVTTESCDRAVRSSSSKRPSSQRGRSTRARVE